MQNAPVVVAPASPHNCVSCAQPLKGLISRHVCQSCGLPQPVSPSEDYFEALGVPRKFKQDPQELEKRFYDLSRALHPDRFTTSSIDARALSLQRMSFLNQAYSTLKNPGALRDYLLQLEGIEIKKGKGTIPVELAESWFEIQDLLMESGESEEAQEMVTKRLADFKGELDRVKDGLIRDLSQFERDYDSRPSREILEKMAWKIQEQSYLQSLEKDVERIKPGIKTNAYSN